MHKPDGRHRVGFGVAVGIITHPRRLIAFLYETIVLGQSGSGDI
jgi:hypothetical protein